MPGRNDNRWRLAAALFLAAAPLASASPPAPAPPPSPSRLPAPAPPASSWGIPESLHASTPRGYQSDGTIPAVSKGKRRKVEVQPASGVSPGEVPPGRVSPGEEVSRSVPPRKQPEPGKPAHDSSSRARRIQVDPGRLPVMPGNLYGYLYTSRQGKKVAPRRLPNPVSRGRAAMVLPGVK